MKIKTSELTGAALDWAVAVCEGVDLNIHSGLVLSIRGDGDWWYPSTDWAQGGPIIEREGIAVTRNPTEWCAYRPDGLIHTAVHSAIRWTGKKTGPTPLIAAMRCYVASKLGDEVDVPDQLI